MKNAVTGLDLRRSFNNSLISEDFFGGFLDLAILVEFEGHFDRHARDLFPSRCDSYGVCFSGRVSPDIHLTQRDRGIQGAAVLMRSIGVTSRSEYATFTPSIFAASFSLVRFSSVARSTKISFSLQHTPHVKIRKSLFRSWLPPVDFGIRGAASL